MNAGLIFGMVDASVQVIDSQFTLFLSNSPPEARRSSPLTFPNLPFRRYFAFC
ncbi:hypothetical protein NG794_13295 [Laspinema sp. D6]|nr:hypothetical protein [Laspinema sp. D3a]